MDVLPVCMNVYMCAGARKGQKRVSDSSGNGVTGVMWVLELNPSLNHRGIATDSARLTSLQTPGILCIGLAPHLLGLQVVVGLALWLLGN